MTITLANKKILVVGAAGLLGARVVNHLISAGAYVHAADLNREIISSQLSESLISGENCLPHNLDITSEDSLDNLFNEISQIDGAVNCSYPKTENYGAHFWQVSQKQFNENLSLNLGSSFGFSKRCAEYFDINRQPFSLVNCSSIYGVITPKFNIYEGTKMTTPVEYVAIKSAQLSLDRYISAYISNSEFRINSVSPGGLLDNQDPTFIKNYKRHTHGTGMLLPDDICGAIMFLLSDAASFITGQNLIIDDGFTI